MIGSIRANPMRYPKSSIYMRCQSIGDILKCSHCRKPIVSANLYGP